MKSVILGSGASEGIPAAFCRCPVCTKARELSGKAVRTRSDFYIDSENLIDFGPDIFTQCIKNGLDLRDLKNIFVTHFHDDHFSVSELLSRAMGYPHLTEKARIYASAPAIAHISNAFDVYTMHLETTDEEIIFTRLFEWVPLEPFRTYTIDGMTVIPIYASHYGFGPDERGFNYIITDKSGRTFLYATDTGWYRDDTWEYLDGCGIKLDYAVTECTYGSLERPEKEEGHMNFKNLCFFLERLSACGLIDRKTPVFLTHICHYNTWENDRIAEYYKEKQWNVIPGYDGMRIPEI